MKLTQKKLLVLLHVIILIYSMSSIFSKLAAENSFFSVRFCLLYIVAIFLLGVYAIGWQQVIKRMQLTTAFANKAMTVVWGIIFGIVIFGESVSVGKIIGAIFVVIGVILYAFTGGVDT